LSFGSSDGLSVRDADPADYEKIGRLAEYFSDRCRVTRMGKEYDALQLPALVVSTNGHVTGVLSYALEADSLVIVLLDVLPGYQGLGAGRMLLDAAKEKAAAEGKPTIAVCASNDDLPGIYFYQKNGFRIYDVRLNGIAQENGGVEVGFAGIPCRDEIRLRFEVVPR
jgi:GNAT superfamily N-acetyltransferase